MAAACPIVRGMDAVTAAYITKNLTLAWDMLEDVRARRGCRRPLADAAT
jgi:hypothetical protein